MKTLVTKKPPISLVTATSTDASSQVKFGASGRELWASITSEFDVSDAGGIAVLKQVCAAVDRVAELSAQISIDGPVVYVKGCPKAHPALRDELANRIVALYRRVTELESQDGCAVWEADGGTRRAWLDARLALHVALGRKPWDFDVMDCSGAEPLPTITNEWHTGMWRETHELFKQLAAAAGDD